MCYPGTTIVASVISLFGDDALILRETDYRLLLLAAVLPLLGTALVSPLLESLIGPFGASSATIGLMMSVFLAPAIVMIPVAGSLADRYTRKAVLVPSVVCFGIAGTAIAFTTDYTSVLAFRFLQGAAFAGINPIIITSIGDLYEAEREATGQGIRFMVAGLSGAIFPLLAGVLVIHAWQYPFLLYAMAFPIAFGLYRWFEEPTTPVRSIPADGTVPVSYTRLLFRLLRHRRVRTMVVARALMPVVWIGFLTYNSLIVVRLMGGTTFLAGVLVALAYFVFALVASQAGRITNVFESRLQPLIGANISISLGFVVVLFAPGPLVALVGITLTGVGFGVLGAIYRSIITSLAPTDLRAGLVSLSEAGGRLTSTLTPLLMGGVIAFASPIYGFAPALRLAGIVVAVGGGGGGIVCLLVVSRSPPVPRERFETPA